MNRFLWENGSRPGISSKIIWNGSFSYWPYTKGERGEQKCTGSLGGSGNVESIRESVAGSGKSEISDLNNLKIVVMWRYLCIVLN